MQKQDDLSFFNDVYMLFNELLNIRRHDNETLENYESCFAAELYKFNSDALFTRLCEALSALLLLNNANVDDNFQKFSILASYNGNSVVKQESASQNSASTLLKTNEEYIKGFFYKYNTWLLRSCRCSQTPKLTGVSVNSEFPRPELTPEELAKKNLILKCRKCGKCGHWHSDHVENGRLKPDKPSRDTSEEKSGNRAVTLKMVNVNTFSN